MLKKKKLEENVVVGGGATGVSMSADPASTAPSKRKQDKDNAEPMQSTGGAAPTDPQNNVAPTQDNAVNVASIQAKAKPVAEDATASDELLEAFGQEDLTEDFKSKVALIFNARLDEERQTIRTELEEDYNAKLERTVESLREEYSAAIDKYLSYAVEEWKKENTVALEHALRTEMTETFMNKLRTVFLECNFNVPDTARHGFRDDSKSCFSGRNIERKDSRKH
jgi:hypothetical protein